MVICRVQESYGLGSYIVKAAHSNWTKSAFAMAGDVFYKDELVLVAEIKPDIYNNAIPQKSRADAVILGRFASSIYSVKEDKND